MYFLVLVHVTCSRTECETQSTQHQQRAVYSSKNRKYLKPRDTKMNKALSFYTSGPGGQCPAQFDASAPQTHSLNLTVNW